MWATITLVVTILVPMISMATRMRGAAKNPMLFWIFWLAAGAVPSYVGWTVLHPEVVDGKEYSVSLTKGDENKKLEKSLKVQQGQSILVTGDLGPLADKEKDDSYFTNYKINFFDASTNVGAGECKGELTREADSNTDIKGDSHKGKKIKSSDDDGSISGGNEDLEARCDLWTSGELRVELSNWHGSAVKSINLQVITGPPAPFILWTLAGVFSLLGIYYEVRYSVKELAGLMGFLGFYAAFMPEGVSPSSGAMNVAMSALPGLFAGLVFAGGVAFIASKYVESKK